MKVIKSKLLWLTVVSTLLLIMQSCTDACKDVVCENSGICMEGTCECPKGFTGTKCTIEDKCITQNPNCLNGGTCVDGTCKCPDDFTGADCATKIVMPCDAVDCQNGGSCVDGTCECLYGFSGERCQNEDPCKTEGIVCENDGTCLNGACICPDGFTGPSCETKVENPCDNVNCQNGGTCINGACNCPNGFSGTLCEKEDKCITQPPNCLNGGVCIDGKCDCPSGYSGDRCQNFDACVGVSCRNGGRCVNGECDCPEGYTGHDCSELKSTVHTFTPPPVIRFYPSERVRGDAEFGGNGPEVWAEAEIFIKNKRELKLRKFFRAKETRGDGSEGKKEEVTTLRFAPPGKVFHRIVSETFSKCHYMDNDHALDVLSATQCIEENCSFAGNLVNRFEIIGDTSGDDLHQNRDYDANLDIYFNPITYELVNE